MGDITETESDIVEQILKEISNRWVFIIDEKAWINFRKFNKPN
jgi:hypothetical protein